MSPWLGSENFSGSVSTSAALHSFGNATPMTVPSFENDRKTIRPTRNLIRPRTNASVLRGNVAANARTSSTVTATAPLQDVFARAAGSDAWRLVRLLRIDRRPGRVHETGGPIPLVQLEQRLERLRLLVHALPRVPVGAQPFGHRRDRQSVRVQRVDLVPGQRRRHLRTGTGADRPRAEDGLVRRVLVVVDEDAAAALLLPPRCGEQLGTAPLELARDCDGCRTHFVGVPARLEPDVNVEAAVPGRLWIADDPELVEQAAELRRRGPHVVEVHARLRVEVETELVR